MKTLSSLAARYWFDAVILAGLGVSLAGAVVGQEHKDGPAGPLWLDVLGVLGYLLPLFARRRFPFGAPAAVPVAVVLVSLVDKTLVPSDFVAFLAGCAAVFLFALLRDRSQAVAGLALALGAEAVVSHNDPHGGIGDVIFLSLIFAVVWTIGLTLGRKFQEADEARERAVRAEWEREQGARAAVAEERARIARELHDVVGHSVSVMTVQASGGAPAPPPGAGA